MTTEADRMAQDIKDNRDTLQRHIETCERQGREQLTQTGEMRGEINMLTGAVCTLSGQHHEIIEWQKSVNNRAWLLVGAIVTPIFIAILALTVDVIAARINQPQTGTTITTSYSEKDIHHAHAN